MTTLLAPAPVVLDIDRIRLAGRAMTVNLRDALTRASWESRIDGATVLRMTVHDPDRTLIRTETELHQRTVIEAEDRRFEIADLLKRGSFVDLVCDDWIRAELGEHAGWLAAPAEVTTRAGFIRLLADQAGVPCETDPDAATVNTPLARGTDRTDQPVYTTGPAGDTPAGAGYPTVSQAQWAADPDLAVAATIGIVARQVGASPRATLAAYAAALVESRCQNVAFGDRDSLGVFQQRNAWGPAEARLNPAQAARMFFSGGQGGQKGALHYDARGVSHNGTPITSAGDLAQAVQVSAHPTRYDDAQPQAADLANQVAGQVAAGAAPTVQEEETSWQCGQRLARETQLRSLTDGHRWLFGSDDWLRSRGAAVQIRERSGGVGPIDFDIRARAAVDVVRFPAQGMRWAVTAGHPVHILDLGVASGEDWLVTEVRGDLFTSDVQVTCTRAHVPLPEPVAPTPPSGPAPGVAAPRVISRTGFQWPTVTGRVISVWGDPRDGGKRSHKGIDIADPAGTPIYAAKDGTVRVAHDRNDSTYGGYGLVVYIDHPDGWQTRYAHNTANLVEVGQQVVRGQPIATVGTSGNASQTPPHNHFETRYAGNAVDPATVLPAR